MTTSLFNNFFPPHIITWMSDAAVDFSFPNGSLQLSNEQKDFLCRSLAIDPKSFVSPKQVHGVGVHIVDEKNAIGHGPIEADGVLTKAKNTAIAIRTADCVPVFIYDQGNDCIGVVHAGWKGTLQGVVPRTIEKLGEQFGTKMINLRIAFGPAIRQCCYQVGEEFNQHFPGQVIKKRTGLYIDLPAIQISQLLKMGVEQSQIFDSGICTCCSDNYFSYRRQGQKAGRMLSLMMIH